MRAALAGRAAVPSRCTGSRLGALSCTSVVLATLAACPSAERDRGAHRPAATDRGRHKPGSVFPRRISVVRSVRISPRTGCTQARSAIEAGANARFQGTFYRPATFLLDNYRRIALSAVLWATSPLRGDPHDPADPEEQEFRNMVQATRRTRKQRIEAAIAYALERRWDLAVDENRALLRAAAPRHRGCEPPRQGAH